MINLTAQLDADLAALSGKQLPFITSVALNQTAAQSRETVRGELPKKFRLRNQWTKQSIRSKFSTRSNLVAVMTAADYMAKQETGGTIQPDGKYLATPGEALRTGRIIPKSKRPRALMAAGKAFIVDGRDGGAGIFTRTGRKGRKQIKLLYWLSDTQEFEPRFEFEEDVRNEVQRSFGSNFLQAFAKYGTR